MNCRKMLLGVAVLTAATLLSGILQGRMSNRWGQSVDVTSAAERLQRIPDQIGPWRLRSSADIGETARSMLQCAGEVAGAYEHRDTGEIVNLILLLGPPGPISVHTPEVCFPSRNYRSIGERERLTTRDHDQEQQFWHVDYRMDSLRGDVLRVYYAWSTGDRWLAPQDARFAFAGKPYLYKIQLSAAQPPGVAAPGHDVCETFLRDFVPVAEAYMCEPSQR